MLKTCIAKLMIYKSLSPLSADVNKNQRPTSPFSVVIEGSHVAVALAAVAIVTTFLLAGCGVEQQPAGPPATQEVFKKIYETNAWQCEESRSGPGSSQAETLTLSRRLVTLLRRHAVGSLLDAACGDVNWMRRIDIGSASYLGMDIVPALIADNQRRFAAATGRNFIEGDFTQDALPKVDLIICRDALVHLPLAQIHQALANFKRSGSVWLLTTHYPAVTSNREIEIGEWRAVNLTAPPFDLPPPVEVLREADVGQAGLDPGKQLALWRLADL